jgi:hypothetical protein
MVSDELDTSASDMMKCRNKVSTFEYPQLSQLLARTFGLLFPTPCQSIRKVNKVTEIKLKFQIISVASHVLGKALSLSLSDTQSILAKSLWSAINQ